MASYQVAPPTLKPGANSNIQPFSIASTRQDIHQKPVLVDNWKAIAIARLKQLVDTNRSLKLFLHACVHCGACSDKCHFFLGSGDPKNMPVARQDLLRSVYIRYHTFFGRWFPWLVGAKDLDEEMLDDWYRYFHQCSQCRRCAVFCPFGIDTTEFSITARKILHEIGYVQKYTHEIIEKAAKTGNNLALPKPVLEQSIEAIEEDIAEETGIDIKLPIDKKGAEILFIAPSADFFAEPHVASLIGYAKVLHATKQNWTFSSRATEAANFAFYINDQKKINLAIQTIKHAAKELGVKRIVFGECGHAWRVADNILRQQCASWDFLYAADTNPQHVVELTYASLQKGLLTFDKQKNDHYRVTFHDSCNIARASAFGKNANDRYDYPRKILAACCNHFYEMPLETTHEKTFCCGGGAGLLTDELKPLRLQGASPRMAAFKYVVEQHQVNHLVTICAICKSQFAQVFEDFDFDREQVVGLHQLVANALVLS